MAQVQSDNLDILRRFLLKLPQECQFQFTNQTRKQIRKQILLAISKNGNYLNWILPFENDALDTIMDKLDQFDWKLSQYYHYNSKSSSGYHGNKPCAKIFRKGEPVIRCLTCGLDEACALCNNCYNPDFHPGHKIHIAISQLDNGGVCDCGDPEAWVHLPKCSHSNNKVGTYHEKFEYLPNDLIENTINVIRILLDYVIDVMSQAKLQFENSDLLSTSSIEIKSINSTLDPKRYGYDQTDFVDKNSPKYCLMVYNDQIRHYRDAVQRIHLASKKVKQFAEMVTDKVHHYGKAKVITSQDIKLLQERQKILNSTGLATSIRSERDLFREDMCDEILIWIVEFSNSEIFKFNLDLRDSFCKAFLERWNIGLLLKSDYQINYEYKVGTLDSNFSIPKIPTSTNSTNKAPHWNFEPSKWSIPEELCIACDYNLSDKDYDPLKSHLGSRLQYFLYFDIRFWKSIRVKLNDMFNTTIVTNLTYKNIVAAQYFDIYPSVADMFLNIDREPECSMMSTISMQLFTCPSNSSSIIKHGGVSKIFATVYGYLNSGEVKSPSNIEIMQEISMKSLKNGRWSRLFVDMGYLFSKGRDADTILTNNIIPIACDILALFQGKPVIKREKENHIEYESPDYTAFFNTILAIYKFAEYIARCLSNLENIQYQTKKSISKNAIIYVIQFLLRLEHNDYPGLVEDNVDIDLLPHREIIKDEINNNIIWNYRIDEQKVSFLHPLHSFLSVLIELAHFDSQSELEEVFQEAVNNSLVEGTPNPLTSIFEYPIRTIALMSQIKSGFWVRNGYTVRSQLHLYRNSGIREYGYLRDLFLVQVFVCSCDPNLVCFLIFNRWLLMDGWISNNDNLVYDLKTLPYMLEECMNFFMHILTENLHLRGLSDEAVSEENLKREIIHSLCFGPATYTKLCSLISDHITAEKRFEIILQEIANYSCPTGSNDTGIYTLKEKYLEKVNPYYYNYSTNSRDECIKFVKERTRVKTGENLDDIVINPVVGTSDDLRIHKHIGNFCTSPYFASFIIRTLQFVVSEGSTTSESLIEATLHLIHACSLEATIDINKYGTFYKNFFYHSDVLGASIATVLYDFLADEKLKRHHSKIRFIFNLLEAKYGTLTENLSKNIPNFDARKIELNTQSKLDETELERKKRIAQERQAKLLAKFKKQQSLFLKNNFENSEYSDIEMEPCDDDKSWKFPEPHCILCQNAAEDAGPFGIITYISRSSEFRNVPFNDKYWFLKAFSDCANLDQDEHDHDSTDCKTCTPKSNTWNTFIKNTEDSTVVGPGFSNAAQVESKLVSLSCGHGMHFQCYMNFLNNNKNRLNQITRNSPENAEHKEFLCPLCKALNNMFMPILWSSNNRKLVTYLEPSEKSDPFQYINNDLVQDTNWFEEFTRIADRDIEDLSILTPTSKEIISLNSVKDLSPTQLQFKNLLASMFQTISLLTFPQVYKADCTFLLANSIKSSEISLRGISCDNELVVNQLSNNTLINLRMLNEFRNTSVLMKIKNWILIPAPRSDAYARMMTNILSLSLNSFNNSILEVDFFDCLASIVPIPSFGMNYNCLLSKCFLGHLIQNLHILADELSSRDYNNEDYTLNDIPIIAQTDKDTSIWAAKAFKKVRSPQAINLQQESTLENINFGYIVYSLLVKASTPFLRRAAILASVQCADTESIDFSKYSNIDTEADRLCHFLRIKSIKEVLALFFTSNTYEGIVFHGFSNFLKTLRSNESLDIRQSMEYPGIIKLCNLPERLDFFFSNYYYLEKYNYPYSFIEDPAICLFCGEIVDAQKNAIGCKEGQCTTHFLKECPNNIGIFLLPKERTFLLLHRNGGSFHNAPFLDQHGELPGEAKKAKALYLMKPRYNDFIKNVWLQHNVPNFIVRNLDSVLDAGGWDTL